MPRGNVEAFAADVRRSLLLTPRQVSSKYFYDALGSALFEAICELPWYRVTRAETALIERHGAEILTAAAPLARVVELGVGSGSKLAALLAQRQADAPLALRLIDVSQAALDAAERVLGQLPALHMTGYEAPYEQGLASVAAEPAPDGRTLALFLGSNIGNFDPPAANALLARVRRALRPGDLLALGTDLIKPEPDLLLAYDDPLGVTAAFNLNVCARMNRELGATFDLDRLRHLALWNEQASRVEMHLEVTQAHVVEIPAAGLTLPLTTGERIWTESSYKYEAGRISEMFGAAGFRQTAQWVEPDAGFAITLAAAI